MKKTLLFAAVAMMTLPLIGCATARGFIAANPEFPATAAVARERMIGMECARNAQAGTPVDAAKVVGLEYERIAADAMLFRDVTAEARSPVDSARDLTDRTCGPLVAQALRFIAPATPPPEPAPAEAVPDTPSS